MNKSNAFGLELPAVCAELRVLAIS